MNNSVLRDELFSLLESRNAHLTFQQAVADFPLDKMNSKVSSIPYSAWELIEHMRICQYDILDFIQNPDYKEPKWPDEYWPSKGKKADQKIWQQTVDQFRQDLESIQKIIRKHHEDLTAPLDYAPQYTLIREILLVADHNAYHLGQLLALKRALGAYND
ncbi:DinB family protein [candidate division KSB1 bacterium]|nr:DinB family protein [candidate division KSB1 bacterium]